MPADWQDYEDRVLGIFETTGFDCQRNVLLQGARATHQIDVAVRAIAAGGEHLWIVECKKHLAPVKKRDVMTLGAVLDDLGADHGFIVSESGFQRGALGMALNANITLCNVAELNSRFRAWQLSDRFGESKHYRAGETYQEDDDGMGSSHSIVSLWPITGRDVKNDIVEIVVRADDREWVISRERALRLIENDGRLNVMLPWMVQEQGMVIPDHREFLGPFWHKDGERLFHVSTAYELVFRTKAGAVRAWGSVPMFK